ncbi:MAG: RNA polymerase sigma factor [Bacteroidota bacterium]
MDFVTPLHNDTQKGYISTSNPDLEQLISLCVANDRSAQEQLYKQYYGKMMGVCRRYFQNRDDAMEVLNCGFLKVYQNLKHYEQKGPFEAWIYRIIYNTIIDFIRSKKTLAFQSTSDLDQLTPTASDLPLQKLYADDLLKLLYQLPDATRTVFNMFAIDGYKHEEIAGILNISEGTSKWHVNHARQQLKALIERRILK